MKLSLRKEKHFWFILFCASGIVAIAACVGRAKDKARIEQLLQQADLDRTYLADVLQRHKLTLPTL